MPKCKRCEELGREPQETGKVIDGVPVCTTCMLEDADKNHGRAIDYSYLQGDKKPDKVTEPEQFICKECGYEAKSKAGLTSHKKSKHGKK